MIKWNDIIKVKPLPDKLCICVDGNGTTSFGSRINGCWVGLTQGFGFVRWWAYCEELPE